VLGDDGRQLGQTVEDGEAAFLARWVRKDEAPRASLHENGLDAGLERRADVVVQAVTNVEHLTGVHARLLNDPLEETGCRLLDTPSS
jgi:hypothetical protein